MPSARPPLLEPRKSPVQARSATSVQAILDATLQVLVSVGKERLTTTRVAQRAGVSVGTLYQYFPNKSALLRAALQRHLEEVVTTFEQACAGHTELPLLQRILHAVDVFVDAKMRHLKTSVVLYSVSSDVDGKRIALQNGARIHAAIFALLDNGRSSLNRDPHLVASILRGAMVGVVRSLLEEGSPDKRLQSSRQELKDMIAAYLVSCGLPR